MTDQALFRPVISLWEPRSALADDLQIGRGMVDQWWNRDSIPLHWVEPVAEAAARRSEADDRFAAITKDRLIDLATERRRAGAAA